MRILYLLPAPVSRGPMGAAELPRRERLLQQRASVAVLASVRDTDEGPTTIESLDDERRAIPGTLRAAVQAEVDGFDAIIVGCFSDPGVAEARGLLHTPVVGPAEASFLAACMLGPRFGVITVVDGAVPLIDNAVRRCGLQGRCAGIRVIGTPVLQIANDRAKTMEAVVAAGESAVDCGADVLVLGCMSLGFLDLAAEIGARVGVPVICPVTAALRSAEAMLTSGWRHNQQAYRSRGTRSPVDSNGIGNRLLAG